jgi:hypothetical protein
MSDPIQEFEDSLILIGYSPEMAEQIARKMFEDHKQEGK